MRIAALIACLAIPAQASTSHNTHSFCWVGAEGFRVQGTIIYPQHKSGLLTEADLTEFTIQGFRDGEFIGDWSLSAHDGKSPIVIRFDADALVFPMGGNHRSGTYQAWNAGGDVTDCGNPGFGFNGGNRAQDICVDGKFIEESGVDADKPLRIGGGTMACGPLQLSHARERGELFIG